MPYQIIKKIIYWGLLVGSSISIQAQYLRPESNRSKQANDRKLKFGLQGGIGILYFLSEGQGIASYRGGIFTEYKIARWIGIQSGLTGYYNLYFLQSLLDTPGPHVSVGPIYLMVPIVLRVYPGMDRQNCFFGGTQLGYLIAGSAHPYMDVHEKGSVPSTPLHLYQPRANKLGISFLGGYDYEFTWGLVAGLIYIHDYMPVLKARLIDFEWTIQPTIGYNLAKLLKPVHNL